MSEVSTTPTDTGLKEVRLAYPQDLIQAVGQYLLTRPMGEVRQLVDGLERAAVHVELPLKIEGRPVESHPGGAA